MVGFGSSIHNMVSSANSFTNISPAGGDHERGGDVKWILKVGNQSFILKNIHFLPGGAAGVQIKSEECEGPSLTLRPCSADAVLEWNWSISAAFQTSVCTNCARSPWRWSFFHPGVRVEGWTPPCNHVKSQTPPWSKWRFMCSPFRVELFRCSRLKNLHAQLNLPQPACETCPELIHA